MQKPSTEIVNLTSFPLMNEMCYLYFPTCFIESYLLLIAEEIISSDAKTAQRRIFEGQIKLSSLEETEIQNFSRYLSSNKIQLDPWWGNPQLLRVLQANKFKHEKTVQSVTAYIEWRKTKLPPQNTTDVQDFLNQGAFYVLGRDNRFRPIVVINAVQLETKQKQLDLALDALTFLFEFILDQYMLPGQIENWVVILDMGKLGVTGLPKNVLQKLMSYLSNNYRSRMFICYIVNCPRTITFGWNLIKSQLEECTVKKINFFNDGTPLPIFTHCHPSQFENKFGGKIPNQKIGQFWPPQCPSEQYFVESDQVEKILVSRAFYLDLYKQQKLNHNRVLQQLIEENNLIKLTQIQTDLEIDTPVQMKTIFQVRDTFLDDQVYSEQEGILPSLKESCIYSNAHKSKDSSQQLTPKTINGIMFGQTIVYTKPYQYDIKACFSRHQNQKTILF